MGEVTPLGALARGLAAGVVGSGVQSLFFKLTARLEPETPSGTFLPPEPQQASEVPVQTVARRFVEGLMQRGPLSESAKSRGGDLVHFAYGAGWGALWGLARESSPRVSTAAGVAAFSNLVWLLGDELMFPVFRLGSWPQTYALRSHAYANVAHLAYGLGVCFAYEALRRPLWSLLGTALWAFGARRAVRRSLPRAARPMADRLADAAAAVLKSRRPSRVVSAFVHA